MDAVPCQIEPSTPHGALVLYAGADILEEHAASDLGVKNWFCFLFNRVEAGHSDPQEGGGGVRKRSPNRPNGDNGKHSVHLGYHLPSTQSIRANT